MVKVSKYTTLISVIGATMSIYSSFMPYSALSVSIALAGAVLAAFSLVVVFKEFNRSNKS